MYFSKIVECEYLFVRSQQLSDIFSIVHANLHARLSVLATVLHKLGGDYSMLISMQGWQTQFLQGIGY
jgi:hypothetical protein